MFYFIWIFLQISWATDYTTSTLIDPIVEQHLLSAVSVDDFLDKLKCDPKTQDYLENFVPIWKSDSLQQSFFFCPRILMHNKDASLSLSFTDCKKYTQKRDDIEIVQWNQKEKKFELWSVHYVLNGEEQKPKLGQKNPTDPKSI